jgi:hypothetical protein
VKLSQFGANKFITTKDPNDKLGDEVLFQNLRKGIKNNFKQFKQFKQY